MTATTLHDEISRYVVDPGAFQDPYPLLVEARSLGPVVELVNGSWAALGYDAVEVLLRTPALSRQACAAAEVKAIAGNSERGEAAGKVFGGWFVNLDAPEHTRMRKLASPAFRPRVVAEFSHHIEAVTDQLVDRLLSLGETDFLHEFAYQLPHLVICEMLGVPAEDHERWGRWLHTIMQGNRVVMDSDLDPLRDAFSGFGTYCRDLLRARYADPGEGLLGSLITAKDEGRGMTEDEMVSTLVLLVVAGHETTVHLISNGMFSLLRFPDQWRRLQDDPALAAQAVEEALRYEPSARLRPRMAVDSVTISGVEVPAGAVVQPVVPAANRDPSHFEEPERFDITRTENPHLTFGFGMHYCIGAAIARREAVIAFEHLARHVELELAGDVRWRHAMHRSLEALPVRVKPR